MKTLQRDPRRSTQGNLGLILGIVVLQAAILLLIFALIYGAGGIYWEPESATLLVLEQQI